MKWREFLTVRCRAGTRALNSRRLLTVGCDAAGVLDREPSPHRWSRVVAAVEQAFTWHADQRRKQSDVPYVGHLLGVAALVIDDGGDEDQIVAALLHDAPEDQGGRPTLTEIARRFGREV